MVQHTFKSYKILTYSTKSFQILELRCEEVCRSDSDHKGTKISFAGNNIWMQGNNILTWRTILTNGTRKEREVPCATNTVCCSVLQCAVACCSVLQWFVVLQCVAACHSVYLSDPIRFKRIGNKCSVSQCATVCYSVLQCVAVCCSVLQGGCCSVLQCVFVQSDQIQTTRKQKQCVAVLQWFVV